MASTISRSIIWRNKCLLSSCSYISRSSSTKPALQDEHEVRPFSDIPAPTTFKLYWNFLTNPKFTNHVITQGYFDEYGPIYKFRFGKFNFVNVADPESAKQMMKFEGQYPVRFKLDSWLLHREGSGYPPGLLISDDESWQRSRSAVNRHMMRPQSVALHTEDFNRAAQDLLNILQQEVEKGDGKVEGLREYLFRWAIESACCIIFEERLGCLSPNPPADIKDFTDAIQEMFETSEPLVIMAGLAKALKLPMWNKHAKSWDTIIQIGAKYGMKRLEKAKKALEAGEEVHGLVPSMLQHSDLNDKEIMSNLIDLMAGAVDTTSGTIQWALYKLAKYPDVQQKLLEEITRVVPPGVEATQQHLNNMTYLKAMVKETLRLNPVVPFTGRFISEDAVISGYHVPKGTYVNVAVWSLGRNPEVFTDPDVFRPERWLRENASMENHHPYSYMSFGYGARSCIGRRVAELEVYLLLVKIIQCYEILDGSPDIEHLSEIRILLLPKGEPDITFKKRS